MTGDSCLARAVVPRTAAAVDHADTELIGRRGWEGTGFLCDVLLLIGLSLVYVIVYNKYKYKLNTGTLEIETR